MESTGGSILTGAEGPLESLKLEQLFFGTFYARNGRWNWICWNGHRRLSSLPGSSCNLCRYRRNENLPSCSAANRPFMSPAWMTCCTWRTQNGGIDFATDLSTAAADSDVIFIAVGTPPLPTGEADLDYLEAAARSIGAAMDGTHFRVVVNKSTVPVGSGNLVETLVREGISEARPERAGEIRFGVASNPEFLREGNAMADSLYPDRIVVGGRRSAHNGDHAGTVSPAGGADL